MASRVVAQVSKNQVDFRRISLRTAFGRVLAEAAARRVLAVELIGLLPRQPALHMVQETLAVSALDAGSFLDERLLSLGFVGRRSPRRPMGLPRRADAAVLLHFYATAGFP